MKLSEAIRLGAALREQAYFEMFVDDRSCALGAAAEAIGCKPAQDDEGNDACCDRIAIAFPILHITVEHPQLMGKRDQVQWLIASLNDNARWTRQQIADWVEVVETTQGIIIEEPQEATCAIG